MKKKFQTLHTKFLEYCIASRDHKKRRGLAANTKAFVLIVILSTLSGFCLAVKI